MEKEVINAKSVPATFGPFSQAVKVPGYVFTSGQLGIDASSGNIVDGGIEQETRKAIENLKAILEASGSSLDQMLKTTVFITNMNDFAEMNQVYGNYFNGDYPARSTVEVSAPARNAKVEIEAIALCK